MKNIYQVFYKTCNKMCIDKREMYTENGITYIAYCGIHKRPNPDYDREVHYVRIGETRFLLLTYTESNIDMRNTDTQYGIIDKRIKVYNDSETKERRKNHTIYTTGPLSKFRLCDGYGRQFQGLISSCGDVLRKYVTE